MGKNSGGTVSIIYEDPWFLAVHKPEGMLVHRSPLDRGETRFALQEARNLAGRRLYPLHRLDRPTSGILLFASARDAAREGTTLFRKGAVEKTYLAVVRGWLPDEGLIDHPLPDDLGGLRDRAGETGTEREARTAFRRVEIPHHEVFPCRDPSPDGKKTADPQALQAHFPSSRRRHNLRGRTPQPLLPGAVRLQPADAGRGEAVFSSSFHRETV